jgi:hypothetical protein
MLGVILICESRAGGWQGSGELNTKGPIITLFPGETREGHAMAWFDLHPEVQ